jgi:hypothetical protein
MSVQSLYRLFTVSRSDSKVEGDLNAAGAMLVKINLICCQDSHIRMLHIAVNSRINRSEAELRYSVLNPTRCC